MRKKYFWSSILFLIFLFYTQSSQAYSPLDVTSSTQSPKVWSTDALPIRLSVDTGSLGTLSADSAFQAVQTAVNTWNAVDSATIKFEIFNQYANPLSQDLVTRSTLLSSTLDGINPVVYDTDGSFISSQFGSTFQNSRRTIATPIFTTIDGKYREGYIVLNGRFQDGTDTPSNPEDSFQDYVGAITRGFGMMLGLGFSQVNADSALDGDSSSNSNVPLMFPIVEDGIDSFLRKDDIVSLASLYPSDTFSKNTGSVEGDIFFPDGKTPFFGANVIARNISAPESDAISFFSGGLLFGSSDVSFDTSHSLAGRYRIQGLQPGATYRLEVENIRQIFTSPNAFGIDPPIRLNGPDERYSGTSESSDPLTDPPLTTSTFTVSAGQTLTGFNIILNGIPAIAGAKNPSAPMPNSIGATQKKVTMLQFTLTAPANDTYTLIEATLQTSGPADPVSDSSDLGQIYLYQDINGDAQVDAGDNLLGQDTPPSNSFSFRSIPGVEDYNPVTGLLRSVSNGIEISPGTSKDFLAAVDFDVKKSFALLPPLLPKPKSPIPLIYFFLFFSLIFLFLKKISIRRPLKISIFLFFILLTIPIACGNTPETETLPSDPVFNALFIRVPNQTFQVSLTGLRVIRSSDTQALGLQSVLQGREVVFAKSG